MSVRLGSRNKAVTHVKITQGPMLVIADLAVAHSALAADDGEAGP